MSMRPGREQEIPAMTVVARAAFPLGGLAMRIQDALGWVFADKAFVDLFAVRGRLDWKYALGLELVG